MLTTIKYVSIAAASLVVVVAFALAAAWLINDLSSRGNVMPHARASTLAGEPIDLEAVWDECMSQSNAEYTEAYCAEVLVKYLD